MGRALADVIVGHGVAIGRDEEAGALPGDIASGRRGDGALTARTFLLLLTALAVRRLSALVAFRDTPAAEETVHRRALRERRVLHAHAGTGIDLHANRNHRGLHPLHDVGEADRALRGLRLLRNVLGVS